MGGNVFATLDCIIIREIYIETTPYIEVTDEEIQIKIDAAKDDFPESCAPPEDTRHLGKSLPTESKTA